MRLSPKWSFRLLSTPPIVRATTALKPHFASDDKPTMNCVKTRGQRKLSVWREKWSAKRCLVLAGLSIRDIRRQNSGTTPSFMPWTLKMTMKRLWRISLLGYQHRGRGSWGRFRLLAEDFMEFCFLFLELLFCFFFLEL